MKEKDWIEALSLADEKYVKEADPRRKQRFPRLTPKKFIKAAACLCVLGLVLYLFVPLRNTPPSVKKYKNSEYYPVIQQLNAALYTPPAYKNNFQRILADVLRSKENKMDGVPGSVQPEVGAKYRETTDNQVAGIIEADRIKRSDSFIYYLEGRELKVYSIDGQNSALVGTYLVMPEEKLPRPYDNFEFYLSDDCKTVTVIVSGYSDYKAIVKIMNLDVSDPSDIQEKDAFYITGNYISSRMVNGRLLLMTRFRVNYADFSEEKNFLPQIDCGDGFESLKMDDIILPEEMTEPSYTVVLALEEGSLTVEGAAAFLSYSDEVYVSENNIFASCRYYDDFKEYGDTKRRCMTEISRISYGGGSFRVEEPFVLEGYLKDQYSMDEKDGILRVVTSTSEVVRLDDPHRAPWERSRSANLYCVSLADGTTIAGVEGFAPEGEMVQSVRFDGDKAYVCTSVQSTDPVFFFDLSDLHHITYKDTGTIPGFSSSLVNFGNGRLLGIGRDADMFSVKVEIYEEVKDTVQPICNFTREGAVCAGEYKAYYIDRERQLVGLGMDDRGYSARNAYCLFFFDGYELRELIKEEFPCPARMMRCVVIDDEAYILGGEKIVVRSLFE